MVVVGGVVVVVGVETDPVTEPVDVDPPVLPDVEVEPVPVGAGDVGRGAVGVAVVLGDVTTGLKMLVEPVLPGAGAP